MVVDKKLIAEKVKTLIAKGKKEGEIRYQEIMDALSEIDLDTEQIEDIYESLSAMGIEVKDDEGISSHDEEDEEEDEELDLDLSIPAGVSLDDPVKMYLKEIGKVPLLTADEEKSLAKRMEEGMKLLNRN